MFLKRIVPCTLAVLLTVCLCAGGVSVSAAAAYPDMPKGAENLFDPDTMELLGDKTVPAVYENNTLLLASRGGTDMAWGYMAASFELPASLKTAKNGYAIQFHTRLSTSESDGSDAMSVRIADAGSMDYFGSYYELALQRNSATVSYGRVPKYELTLPSTGKCLSTPNPTGAIGEWKEVTLYVQPTASGATLSVFIDGEAMQDKNGADAFALEQMDLCLMFGSQANTGLFRGVRLYAVDPAATAFEPKFDPDAEFGGAEDGTEGKDGGNGGVTLIGDTTDDPIEDQPADTDGGDADDKDGTDSQNDGADSLLPILLGACGGVIVIAAIVIVLIVSKKRKAAPVQSPEKEADEDEKV